MDLTWLEDFLALAEHRTFARAAEARHVTQPAFSRRIQSLEDWMGTRLFVRSPQGTTLTPAGAFLRAQAEDLTRNIYRLRQDALEVAGREASVISIAATHALSFVFFPDWIRSHPQFATLGPLNLISDTMEACEQIMSRGDADFMLCHYHRDAMPRFEASQFTSVVIGRDVLLPLCAPLEDGTPQWPLPGDPFVSVARPVVPAAIRPRPDRDRRPGEELADAFAPEDAHGPVGGDAADHGASRGWHCMASANPRPRRCRSGPSR